MKLTRPADIGALIKDFRRARKLRQAVLAERLQVSPKWLSQFENGKATAQIGLVIRVLNELGFELRAEPSDAAKGPEPGPKPPRTRKFSIDDIVDG